MVDGFSTPYRSDHDPKGGSIMFFVREGIPYNLRAIKYKPIESIYVT